MFKKTVQFLLFFTVVAVLYYSWLPDQTLETETYLPNWLLNWSNYYYNLRTAIPFVVLGFLLEIFAQAKTSNPQKGKRKLIFIQNLGLATIIVCIAEIGQFFIKNRSPDTMDVFFGMLGSLFGGAGYYFINSLVKFKRIRNEE